MHVLSGNEHPSLALRSRIESTIGDDIEHPPEPVFKIERVADSMVIERSPIMARAMVQAGAFTFVPASTTSIVDTLHAMSVEALQTLLGRSDVPRGAAITALIPLIESGEVEL